MTKVQKKVIGVIGGSGPEAGADLFCKILALHRKRLGSAYRSDRDAPDLLLMSLSSIGGPRTAIDIDPNNPRGTYHESLSALLEAVEKIAPLVDAFTVACNTLHMFEPKIRYRLQELGHNPSKFISMISSTTNVCQAHFATVETLGNETPKVSIFGGPVTMDLDGKSSYRRVVDDLGPERIYRPPPSAISVVKNVIWKVKETGEVVKDGEEFDQYIRLIRDVASNNVKVCILACTELPLIDVGAIADLSMTFIDPTEVVANALLCATQSYPT